MDYTNKMRFKKFYANKRARYFLYIFLVLVFLSIFSPFIANEKPLLMYKDSKFYFPIFKFYSEASFGGDFLSQPDYSDPYVKHLLKDYFVIYAPIRYSPSSIDWDNPLIPPSPPNLRHILGTDDQGRDVASRLLGGLSTSLFFGLTLSFFSVLIGVVVGALQGFYGGLVDLLGQRLIEIWSGVPILFLIIILSSFITPTFWWILFIVLVFSWMSIVSVVRVEFLRARGYDYIKASHALGFSNIRIMFVHVLPNALIATITYIPFIIAGSITTLVSLDFLGFGMPLGSASLGEILNQGKNNLQSPHLAIVGFSISAILLSSLVFIGEGVRDAFSSNS